MATIEEAVTTQAVIWWRRSGARSEEPHNLIALCFDCSDVRYAQWIDVQPSQPERCQWCGKLQSTETPA